MAGYLSLSMVEQEYTGTKRRKEMEFSFPETPIKETQVTPDSFQLDNNNNYLVTLTAYSIIGSESSQCNYSDFCCGFDAIKISELINEKENDPGYDCNNPTGLELKEIMQEYYTNYYQKRFEYVLKDLNCAVDVNYTELYNQILAKMTGVDESVLLISFVKKSI